MTIEEEKVFLRELIRNTEQRFIWYKSALVSFHKEKYPENEFTIWYKSHLREMKNTEEQYLKN